MTQEKLVARARLITSGITRFQKFNLFTPEERGQALEILAEELVNIKDQDEVRAIRGGVERFGLQIPEVSTAVQTEPAADVEPPGEFDDVDSSQVEEQRPVPSQYVRRANNQVSEQLEAYIRDLLGCGWKKSAIARALRVNRRVVIRIAREAQNAQKTDSRASNDLGRS